MKRKSILFCTRYLGLFVFAISLTACSTLEEFSWFKWGETEPEWDGRNDRVENIRDWSATGRIAVNTDKEAWNIKMYWHQEGDDYQIRLNGPLGSGAVDITGGPDQVTLRTTDGRTLSAADPESLLFDAMGWRIPISGLRYWILGRPEAGAPTARLESDTEGKLRRLEQSGWDVRYLSYRRVEGVDLPVWLIMENKRLSARVRINMWTLDLHAGEGSDPYAPFYPDAPLYDDSLYEMRQDGIPIQDDAAAIPVISMDTSIGSLEETAPEEEPAGPEEKQGESKCRKDKGIYSIPLVGGVLKAFFCK